jgi:hypothetical protein
MAVQLLSRLTFKALIACSSFTFHHRPHRCPFGLPVTSSPLPPSIDPAVPSLLMHLPVQVPSSPTQAAAVVCLGMDVMYAPAA